MACNHKVKPGTRSVVKVVAGKTKADECHVVEFVCRKCGETVRREEYPFLLSHVFVVTVPNHT